MLVGANTLSIEEDNADTGLRTKVTYFVLPEEKIGGAVADLGDDGVIAGVEEGGEHGGQSGHAAGKDRSVLRAGQGAELSCRTIWLTLRLRW